MIKYFLFLGCIILSIAPSSAQSVKTDTVEINSYLRKAKKLADNDPDSARIMLSRSFKLASDIHYDKGIVRYYHLTSYLLLNENKFEEALDFSEREVALSHRLDDSLLLAKAYNALANSYEYLGIMDSAGKYFLNALQIADNLKNQNLQRRLNNNLSSVLYYSANYEKGYQYALKGFEIAKALNDTSAMISSMLNVGGFESALQKYDSSLVHFNYVISLSEATDNKGKIMDALNNLGELLSNLGRNHEALEKYQQMLLLSEQTTRPDYRMYAEGNMGNTLAQLGQYKQGELHLDTAIQIAENIHAANELQQWLSFMSDLQYKEGDHKKAFDYLLRYQSLKDSLMNEETKENIQHLEIQYESIKKDKELAEQRLNITRQQAAIQKRNSWILLFIGGIILLSIILLISWRNYRNKKMLHKQELLSLQREQEVIRLKSLMEGQYQERQRISREMHDDIGSGLTTILFLSGRLTQQKPEEIRSAGEKISNNANSLINKMNEIVWSMNTAYDTLEDLVAYIRQQAGDLLENNGIEYHFIIPENIPDLEISGEIRRNIFLVVKESLHNILKHANANKVHIKMDLEKYLHISIHDNGKGIDMSQLRHFGNGLNNMNIRMQAVEGNFTISNDHGTEVILTMPLDR